MLTVTSIIFDSRIQNEALALRDAGYHITILCIEDQSLISGLKDAKAIWQTYLEQTAGITTKRIFLKARGWKWLPKSLNKLLQAIELAIKFSRGVIQNRADIYHCHDLIPACFAWLGQFLYKAKVVYDAHELEIDQQEQKGVLRWMLSMYERIMMKRCIIAITVNGMIAEIMMNRYQKQVYIIENRPEYVPNDDLNRMRLRSEESIPDDHVVVMYVGNLSATRGIDKMILALTHLDERIRFFIMGTGRINEFKTLVDELGLQNEIDRERIRFIGPYSPGEVIHYLTGADLSVLLYQPTSNNTLFNAPNKLYQSIVAQVPMIASHNESFPGIIRTGSDEAIGVTVDPSDSRAIAVGIEQLLQKDYYNLAKRNLRKRAKEVSWHTEKEKLLSIYGEMFNAEVNDLVNKSVS